MQEHKNDKLVVRYDPAICIHAGEWAMLVQGQRGVPAEAYARMWPHSAHLRRIG